MCSGGSPKRTCSEARYHWKMRGQTLQPYIPNEYYSHDTIPESINEVNFKTTLCTNSSRTFAAIWTISSVSMSPITFHISSNTGVPWMLCSTKKLETEMAWHRVLREFWFFSQRHAGKTSILWHYEEQTLPTSLRHHHTSPSPEVIEENYILDTSTSLLTKNVTLLMR